MTRTDAKSVSIAPDHTKSALSKGQKAFNALVSELKNDAPV
jgi:hypothetical protein